MAVAVAVAVVVVKGEREIDSVHTTPRCHSATVLLIHSTSYLIVLCPSRPLLTLAAFLLPFRCQ